MHLKCTLIIFTSRLQHEVGNPISCIPYKTVSTTHWWYNLNRTCAGMDCAWSHRLRIEKQCCATWILRAVVSISHARYPMITPRYVVGNHWQAKRCVRDRKLRTMFGPADPVPCEFRDPFSNCSKENHTLSGVYVEPICAKGVQNVCKISKGTQTINNVGQGPSKINIIGVYKMRWSCSHAWEYR